MRTMRGLSSIVAALVLLLVFAMVISITVILIGLFKSYNYSSSTILSTGLSALNCLNDSSVVQFNVSGIEVNLSEQCMIIIVNGTRYLVHPALGSPG
ncbi:hypothetical protein [Caldivirga maquilingensis]|uniref:Uncharacterized protein n=1 Tax=Caldivirga maquilingensis (strain ATCC 700844 / DSM 13496 / JCM 10307 / IC-167) TaxID=397948 RepID=A8MD65_CALMQ|nr:hypothetical protein [Caldivirga maquilingensis]ABW01721.1 hypothetical protein Cmaq_0887 [Caldivirga maquilingensis IC-167]